MQVALTAHPSLSCFLVRGVASIYHQRELVLKEDVAQPQSHSSGTSAPRQQLQAQPPDSCWGQAGWLEKKGEDSLMDHGVCQAFYQLAGSQTVGSDLPAPAPNPILRTMPHHKSSRKASNTEETHVPTSPPPQSSRCGLTSGTRYTHTHSQTH